MDENQTAEQKKTRNALMKRVAKNRFEEIVVCLCLTILTMIMFVLLGGVKNIYTYLEEKYPKANRYITAPYTFVPAKDRTHEIEYGDLNQVHNGADLRDEIFTHLVYADKDETTAQMQGACTDGTYIWGGWSNPYKIVKINILTQEIMVKEYTKEEWRFGHINDMTYNPDTRKLYVVDYSIGSSENGSVAIVDADTLEYESTISLQTDKGVPVPINSIAYDRVNHQYIVGRRVKKGQRYFLFDENFQYLKRISIERVEAFTVQGIETDGTYFYRGLFDNDSIRGNVFVYDLEGNFVKLLRMPELGGTMEIEDIMYDWHGNWFINATVWPDDRHEQAGCVIYYAGLYSDVDYTHMDQFLTLLEEEFAEVRKVSHPTPVGNVT